MQKGFEVVNLHGTASGVIAVPVIGENGNWWIGNEDTGVCAGGGGSSAPNNVYSTKETICGTWIDGKPIYRKVYLLKGSIPLNTDNLIDASNLTNVERVVNLSGTIYNGAGPGVSPLPYASTSNGEKRSISLFYVAGKHFNIRCEVPAYRLSDAAVYIEYTKTE